MHCARVFLKVGSGGGGVLEGLSGALSYDQSLTGQNCFGCTRGTCTVLSRWCNVVADTIKVHKW